MRILVADDDRVSQRVLQALLTKWGHEPILASDGLEALKIMRASNAPKLLLLDWEMPGLDGLEVCRQLRADENPAPPYIIFVTAKDTLVDMVRGLDVGASDFIRKPFNREELRARIRVGERTLNLQAELIRAQDAMTRLAMTDPLTGLYNRRAMLDALDREMARARRTASCLSLGIADIDHFKSINDKYGHPAGDAVLVAFSRAIEEAVRGSDTVGRWGGEEFVILAPHAPGDDSADASNPLFERIRQRVESLSPMFESRRIPFTVSIGVAVARGGEETESVLRAADEALYRAKAGGRNRVCRERADAGGDNVEGAAKAVDGTC